MNAAEVLAFLDDVASAQLEIHSFMLHRRGFVVAEGWQWPYGADRPRILHSATKSFAACAIGLAIEEGRLALADKVVSYFPDHLPATVSENLAAMTVADLLTMRTGQDSETSGSIWRGIRTSWITEFFKIPVVHRPGTKYVYTSAASYMLSAVLSRATGETLHDYLKPRLFAPLGISGETWDVGPDGINPGGNGLTTKTADLLKLGILHAQGGIWEGKRILPEHWVRESTRPQGAVDSSYGYHWAIRPKDAFSAIGVFMQTAIVYPQHGATIAITGAMEHSAALFPVIERHFPKAFTSVADARADAALRDRLAGWGARRPAPATTSPLQSSVHGTRYAIEENPRGMASVRLDFDGDRVTFELQDADGFHTIAAGMGQWIESRTDMPGQDLHHGYRFRDAPVIASARWSDERTLEMEWIFVETAFRDTVTCRFDGGRLTLSRRVNINSGLRAHPDLVGTATA